MKHLLPLTLAMSSFFLLSCSDTPASHDANVVSGRGYEGIVVADESAATHFDGDGEMFQPSPEDVAVFEDMMGPDTLMKADPKEERMDWWRVYSGYEMDGERHMYVQGNCETQPEELKDMPSDGICYWSTSVNLSTNEMEPVDFEGKA